MIGATLSWAIRLYQKTVSPLLSSGAIGIMPGGCRHVPSCSEYAQNEIRRAGVLRGVIRALRRILSCNPLFGA